MKRTQKRGKGEVTKTLIIAKAISLLAKKGYEQTSFQDLANACGVAQATPIYHFKNKEGLFEAVIKTIQINKRSIINGGVEMKDDAFLRLLKYFRGYINWANVYRFEASVYLLLHHFASINLDFTKIYQEILSSERLEIETLVEAGRREKIFATSENGGLLAEILHDAIIGIVTNLMAGRGELNSPRQLEKKSRMVLETTLGYQHGSQR